MRYRTIIFTLLLALLCQDLAAETYTVLFVRGKISVKQTGVVLKPGDKLDSETQVSFADKDAVAALFSSSKGRFTLSAKPADQIGSEFVAYVKSSVVPARKGLSTRAGTKLMNDVDIKNFFTKPRWLILSDSRVEISEAAYPISKQSFFYIRYENEPLSAEVNKKIDWEGEELLLNWTDVLTLGTDTLDPGDNHNYQLFYFIVETKQSRSFGYLNPVFPDEESLVAELKVMLELEAGRRKGFNREAQLKEAASYLEEYHGWVQPGLLKPWMDKHIPQ